MSIKTRLVQLERRLPPLPPAQHRELSEQEVFENIRSQFQSRFLKFEARQVVCTLEGPGHLYCEEATRIADFLNRILEEHPEVVINLLASHELEQLDELLGAGRLVMVAERNWDGRLLGHRMCSAAFADYSELDDLARYGDLALEAWSQQTGEAAPMTTEGVRGWVREMLRQEWEQCA